MVSYVRGAKHRVLPDVEIIRLYVEEDRDSETVGFMAQCSASTVIAIVRAAGHAIRKPGRGVPRPRRIPDEEIVRRYKEEGQSAPLIADAAGVTPGTIYRVLRQHGIAIRPSIRRR